MICGNDEMSEPGGDRSSSHIIAPLLVSKAIELAAYVGRDFAPGRWLSVTQEEINRFVALTGDQNWIHTDVGRAARELPSGKTIVPGQLLLALIPKLLQEMYAVTGGAHGQAAAIREVRFRRAVNPDDAFRIRAKLTLVEQRPRFVQVDASCDLESAEGQRILTSQRTDVFMTETE